MIKAVVTVVGQDQTGIVAGIATTLAKHGVNILDMSQTIMSETFTMSMLVALDAADSFDDIYAAVKEEGARLGVTVHVQRQEIFDTMAHI
ncbi:hypothetical protein FPFC_010630 [Fructobacillus pseudoficulneus]|uniref:UPF0237 protein FPFC_010630 n=1 Tax=Fructobacillus pseudoficulneus TaxID=220714 RepID=A0A3F3GR26_9LACO|nr:ACT domain-containing protein [Fructobacillus pseudoficulneus]GAP02185.1 hypothetical protein FPFC_010630 [Fructobacillus pseudoficulneus]SEH36012.1 ACT domain-containing protein [Fructobacillus pseudoficulneus]